MRLLRFVGRGGCDADAYRKALASGDRVVIDTLRQGGNVTLRFKIDDHPLQVVPDPTTRDFLDFAVCVYIADEIAARKDAPDGWSRSFDLLFPVKEPSRWEAAAGPIAATLAKLSGDEFYFAWPERSAVPTIGRHRRGIPRGFDAVCLFSGGIDSLLGAYKLIADGKKVLLVGHQADPTAASAQRALAGELRSNFPGRAHLIQCRVARSTIERPRFPLPEKVEETHRPRSLLFLAIAIAVARVARIGEVYIPENGLIALNSPLQVSRVGALSTRTAHPAFLALLLDTVARVGAYDGAIRNPFLYESKTDMLRGLDPALKSSVLRSVSCARPSRYKHKKVRHCGYCVPCIYRRVALMAAGLDDAQDYAHDVFRGLAGLTRHKQADFRALVDFAGRVVSAGDAGRDLMVLAHGWFPADIGGRIGPAAARDHAPWSGMMFRWAGDFLDQVETLSSSETRAIVGLPVNSGAATP
jgi:7-cyano-7-deazaguanine synthase in queuosine biosynthesis